MNMQYQDLLLYLLTRKYNNHHCIDSDLVKQVKSHIESFSAQESHYSHSDIHGKLFHSENFSICRMYHLYLEMFEPEHYECNKTGPFFWWESKGTLLQVRIQW